jgi:ligand-binding sensor domain-containing protein/two-component sensor histidine kinase
MRIHLYHAIILLIFAGCKGRSDTKPEINPPLYPEPFTVALNTKDGFTINQLTGDSIKPLINASGDTFITGVPVPLISSVISNEILQPKIVTGFQTIKTIIHDNVYPVPDQLSVTKLDTTRLKKIKLGEGNQSFILKNSLGVVPTGVPIPVTGKKMPFSEPLPVKAAPMRQKDNATASIQYLDVDQGLSYSYVFDVCEDSKGNLWFAMDASGVCKYDGINITNYTEKEGLSNNTVTTILEDRNKNLWLGTYGGATYYDGKGFIQFTEKEGFSKNEVLSISEDHKGNIWFCTKGGLTKYNGKEFIHYTVKEGLPSDTVYQSIEDRNGIIWIATPKGLISFNGNTFRHFTKENGLSSNGVNSLLEDEKGNLWIGSGKGISKFDGKTFTHFDKRDGLSDNSVWSITKDRRGNLWISTTEGGLNKFDGKAFTHYKLEQGVSKIKLRRAIEDRSGNIWFGTDGGGVNKLNANSFDYKLPEEVMDNNRIRPILKDKKGNLWFGTEGNHIGKLDAEQNVSGSRLFTYYKIQDKLSTKGQRSLLEDRKGNIWIGTTGTGIIKYDGKIFTNYSLSTNIAGQSIYDLREDKKGNIWFGTRDGRIVMYDGKNFIEYTIKGGLPGTIIYSVLEDRNGNLWFCTEEGGIYKYDGKTIIIYSAKEGLFNKSITSITEDEKGNIWLGTLGAGVCKYDGKNFIYYSTAQGLADNNVWSVFCDKKNQLWFGTDKGLTLCIADKDNLQNSKSNYIFYNFNAQDGLKAIDFNLHSVAVDNENRIMWGTGKGVPSFDLNTGFQADSIRSLNLSFIKINEQFYDFHNLQPIQENKISFSSIAAFQNYPEGLSLPYNKNHLTFHFSAIDWSAPDKIKYSYRLIGVDANWSSPSHTSYIDYRNLQHGKYELQVKAIGRSQIWTKPVSYYFNILPPWWLTWWFKSIIVLLLLAVIFFIARFFYRNQLRKQKALLEKQLAVQFERQRISAEMHDDIGAGLSGIKLMTEMAKMKSKDEASVSEIEKIYQSVGDISSKMKEVIWSLNTENDSLSSLIAYLQKQARQMMENYPGNFFMTIPETIPDVKISGDARRHIHLLVKEALHNIIKHSGADRIDISISCDEKMRIVVTDNGKGMNTGVDNETGNGMKNMRKRVQQLEGILFLESNNGLKLTFEIPLK